MRLYNGSKSQWVRRSQGLAGLVVAALCITGCATTKGMGQRVDDTWITSKVKTKLAADPKADAHEIDVDVNQGVVRLSGTVETEGERQEAVELASETRGVQRVINDIELGDPTLGENLKDKSIEARLKAKFAGDSEIYPFNIDIDANQGVVTLSGTVRDPEAKVEAQRLARNTEGVLEVRNRILVQGEEIADTTYDRDVDFEEAERYLDTEPEVDTDYIHARAADPSTFDSNYDSYDSRSAMVEIDEPMQRGATNEQAQVGANERGYRLGTNDNMLVGTVVRIESDRMILDTDQGRREIMLDSALVRPHEFRQGARVGVVIDERGNQWVATRLSTDPDDAEFMTFASPDRTERLPQTASHQTLIGLFALLLLSAGALVRQARM